MSEPALPWTRREIIDAVIATYRPPPALPKHVADFSSEQLRALIAWKFEICIGPFANLALGKPEGRAAPYVEAALVTRIARVVTALRDGHDPEAAYDVPLEGEEPLTTEDQLSYGYRLMEAELDKLDRALRRGGNEFV